MMDWALYSHLKSKIGMFLLPSKASVIGVTETRANPNKDEGVRCLTSKKSGSWVQLGKTRSGIQTGRRFYLASPMDSFVKPNQSNSTP